MNSLGKVVRARASAQSECLVGGAVIDCFRGAGHLSQFRERMFFQAAVQPRSNPEMQPRFVHRFVEAASAARRASAANPRFSVPCYLHTAALVGLGRFDDANAMARKVVELQPGFTVSGLVAGNITTRERMDRLARALCQAGLPE